MQQFPIRTRAALAATLLAASSILHAATVEEEVMAVTQAAAEAFRVRDVATIERLLTPDFTLVGSDSRVQSLGDALAEVCAGDPQYDVFRNHGMSARVYGDTAIVIGITTVQGHSGGQPFAADLRFTDTLLRIDGEWRLVASHVSRIPAS